jgi:hypothetical protein
MMMHIFMVHGVDPLVEEAVNRLDKLCRRQRVMQPLKAHPEKVKDQRDFRATFQL